MADRPLAVERDLLELMVAYGFVPRDAIAGARPAAPLGESPAPSRTPGRAVLRLAVYSAGPAAGRTTLVTGLAQAWSRAGASVLLVDLDPVDELARLFLLGSAITVNTGQLLLRAVADGGIAEPSHTLLPGVDIVAAGGLGGDAESLPLLLRRNPAALRDALEPWLDRYDRVLVDVPTAPNALAEAARTITDAALYAVPAATARMPDVDGLFGAVLTRFDPLFPPAASAVAALARQGLLDTAIPEFPGLTSPWHLVAGAAGRHADAAFSALAAEIDARRGSGGPVPLHIPDEDRPTVIELHPNRFPERA